MYRIKSDNKSILFPSSGFGVYLAAVHEALLYHKMCGCCKIVGLTVTNYSFHIPLTFPAFHSTSLDCAYVSLTPYGTMMVAFFLFILKFLLL